jgi:lysophospholipase L1-like esterase
MMNFNSFKKLFVLSLLIQTLPSYAQKKAALIGDSTVATYSSGSKQGWGRYLASHVSGLSVSNFARGGRSSKTFYQEKEWDQALASKAKYLFIQFGHNDSHKGDPKYTDPKSSYKTYLTRFVTESRKKGMTPILVTPVRRARFSGSNPTTELSAYASAMRDVASREKVPLIDLYSISGSQYKKMGKTKTLKYFVKSDTTHFNDSGARLVASWVAAEAARVVKGFPSKK